MLKIINRSSAAAALVSRHRRGFTFIEIMLVVVIIGILMAVAVPQMTGKSQKARVTATRQSLQNIATALQMFEVTAGRFPTTQEGIVSLVERPSGLDQDEWDGPYLKEMPLDAWKQEFVYRSPGEQNEDYDLMSKGPDRQENTEDDLTPNKKRTPSGT